jgi:molybdopterin synthase sulfur carrier subunit
MKVRYFAWMKRTVGISEEDVTPPAEVRTVGELVVWLRARSAGHAEALAEGAAFGAAVDQRTATFDVPIAGAREVAFFPPFTGGF